MFVDERQLKTFKEKLGFDKIVETPRDAGVVANWDLLEKRLPSPEKGWELFTADINSARSGVVTRDWTFHKEDSALTVKVHVSSTGTDAVRKRLVSLATTTSLPFIPYIRGPEQLGQLSVWTQSRDPRRIIWVFHNVCVEIDKEDSVLPLAPLARIIQEFMERHVSPHVPQHLPGMEKVTVSKNPLKVGEEVLVAVHPERTSGELKGLKVEIFAPFEALDLMEQSATASRFQALHPGKPTVEVSVTDLESLLRSRAQVQVEIQANK
ncbi:MAG TPA: hypothetical protein VK447_18195 [Myxococcaceae bacterium]|nr:hypothetical protein [Myxococcaceae bacterium]